jgi:hypothetical protein
MTSNKTGLCIIICVLTTLTTYSQSIFKNNITVFFPKTITKCRDWNVLILPEEIKKDSSCLIISKNQKRQVFLKFKNEKGYCTFQLVDSISKKIVIGEFASGLALLTDQVAAIDPSGDGVIVLENFYKSIMNGDWTIYNLNGKIERKVRIKNGFEIR